MGGDLLQLFLRGGSLRRQIEGNKTRGSKTDKKGIVFPLIMLKLERFFERGATALVPSLLWFLDNVMNLDAVFRFHFDRIVFLVCG